MAELTPRDRLIIELLRAAALALMIAALAIETRPATPPVVLILSRPIPSTTQQDPADAEETPA